MKIIGYVFDGAMYHDSCLPEIGFDVDEPSPIFDNSEIEDNDYCDVCLHEWISSTKPEERKDGAPEHVFIKERY